MNSQKPSAPPQLFLLLERPLFAFCFAFIIYLVLSALDGNPSWVRDSSYFNLLLTLSILATSIPILLLMGTGWVQYGPRYVLDFTVPLLLETASGVHGTSKRLLTWLLLSPFFNTFPVFSSM